MNLAFKKKILIYLPCYNCADYVLDTIQNIPSEFHAIIECLVIDNQSSDGTARLVADAIANNQFQFPVHIIQPTENVGYAGSQKLAYSIARLASPPVNKIIMLHGDGQYDPVLLKYLLPYLDQDLAIVNGYRDRRTYPEKEETPLLTYRIIKLLNVLENIFTGLREKEWHSGFAMYSTEFLSKLPLEKLTPTRHIDGELLMCANKLGLNHESIPIYKRYRGYVSFGGAPMLRYVFNVGIIVLKYMFGHHYRLLKQPVTLDEPVFRFNVVKSG